MDPQHRHQPSVLFTSSLFFKRETACALSSSLLLLLLLLFSFLLYLNIIPPFKPLFFPSQTTISHDVNNSSTATCDYSFGRWVWDENYLFRSYSEDCPFLDPGFQCHRNGRIDTGYWNWRWQPQGCDLPRFNASEMLERSKNGRVIFVGDSIGRNQWESLVCMLAKAVQNPSKIYEQYGNPITKHKGFLSIRFHDYNLTVEYYRAPFLVTVDRPPPNSSIQVQKAIHVDRLHWISEKWVDADLLIFNAGHWWSYDKTLKMGFYFQEGENLNMTMDVKEGFRKSLETWRLWAIKNLQHKSHVFFRNYSPVHFRGGTWDTGGYCDSNTAPETNYTALEAEPWNNVAIFETIERMKDGERNVQLLNITYLTEFRKDGHPSSHREPGTPIPYPEDCSHWCLPGVPDTWNELLYAYLLSKDYNTKNNS